MTFTSALVNGKPARMLQGNVFEAELEMAAGANTVTVQATDGSGNLTTRSYQVDVPAAGTTYSYDPNGNLATKTEIGSTWTYTWDAENRLKKVERDAVEVARFTYGPLGARLEKVAGVTTRYTYGGKDILREVRGTSILTYVHGPRTDEPLALEDEATSLYFHVDGLGSVAKATDPSGAMTVTRRYDAWGVLDLGLGEPGQAFTGREWDPETGLYYYRARYLDAKLGRFISEDPIRFMGGVHFYAYVGDNPQRWVDPYGMSAAAAWSEWKRVSWYPDFCSREQPQAFDWPSGVTDLERHCWCSCIWQRKLPMFPGSNPFSLAWGARDTARAARGTFAGIWTGDWSDSLEGGRHNAADQEGAWFGMVFWKSCEEQCAAPCAWKRNRAPQ